MGIFNFFIYVILCVDNNNRNDRKVTKEKNKNNGFYVKNIIEKKSRLEEEKFTNIFVLRVKQSNTKFQFYLFILFV